ncbi:SpoIIE family protein phosphatase [Sneathiella sp.]|jgi:sigma-B regulation protein RsbU (phosphoserine phosphatase)|uniref:SpoIIE family protein phosphatase n=1 Tax=Sneathiella sp. TaxID=1964365 RepID=UPI0039E225C8
MSSAASDTQSTIEQLKTRHDVKIKNARILVVEDSDLIRELIGACLMTDGYFNISYAENGQDALEVIELQVPDLIVLDLEMPIMDGFELCKELRSRQSTASIPILIQSGRDTAADITRAFDLGATDMIVKPIKKFEILARTKVHLEHRFFVEKLTDFHDRVASELEQARQLQLDICPSKEELISFHSLYGLRIGWHYEPSSELGGDIGGIYPIDENRIAFYIADFSGHGVAAALNTFRMQTWLSSSANLYSSPDLLLKALNQFLYQSLPRGSYATMLFGCLDLTNNVLEYSAAGTQPPLLKQSSAPFDLFSLFESKGMPLGLRPDWDYALNIVDFPIGAQLILYSDALVEVDLTDGGFLGEKGLEQEVNEIWKTHHEHSPTKCLSELIDRFHRRAGSNANDDLTIIHIKNEGQANDV